MPSFVRHVVTCIMLLELSVHVFSINLVDRVSLLVGIDCSSFWFIGSTKLHIEIVVGISYKLRNRCVHVKFNFILCSTSTAHCYNYK